MRSFLVLLVGFLVAGTSFAAGYQCEGKSKGKAVKLGFTITSKKINLNSNLSSQTDTLTRASDWEGLASYELEQEYGDDSGIYGFFMRLAVPKDVAASRSIVTKPFKAAFRFASSTANPGSGGDSDVGVIDTKVNCHPARR